MRFDERRPNTGAASEVIAATDSIVAQQPMDAAARSALARLSDLFYPRCRECGHPLSAYLSVRAGMGPVCRTRVGGVE